MNTPKEATPAQLDELFRSMQPRVRLTKGYSLLENDTEDLPKGALGHIVEERPADETRYVVVFDLLPHVRIDFYSPQFMRGSPEYCIEDIREVLL